MSNGSRKDKPNGRLTRVHAAMRTTDPCWQWLARMRRAIAKFYPEKAKRSPECSDAESKPPTVTEQFYVHAQLERLDLYGFYQQPRRYRANIEPLDQLLGPVEKETKDGRSKA